MDRLLDVATPPAQAVPQLEHPVQAALVVEQAEHFVGGVHVIQLGLCGRCGRAGVIGARGDRDAVLGEHAADLLDPESHLVDVDVVDDQVSRRSSSAAAKNADSAARLAMDPMVQSKASAMAVSWSRPMTAGGVVCR